MINKNVKNEKFYESNSWGTMEVIDRGINKFKVRFLNTGYEVWASRGNVLAGKVADPIAKNEKSLEWFPHHEEFVNNKGHKFKAFQKRANKIKVQFEKTGYCCEVYMVNAKAGKVNDPYEISVYGVGYLGEYKNTKYTKQANQLWRNMMKRCYSEVDQRGYFGKCFVDPRWYCFENFLEDLPRLDNFQYWLCGKNDGVLKYNLDKDSKIPNNKTYSREACTFLTEHENKAAGKKGKVLTELGWV